MSNQHRLNAVGPDKLIVKLDIVNARNAECITDTYLLECVTHQCGCGSFHVLLFLLEYSLLPFSVNFRSLSLLLTALLLSGCGAEEAREYRGHLYFGAGSYLGQLDLRHGSVAVLANLGDTSIRELDAFGDDQLLLSVFGPVNHEDTYRLMQYELKSNGLATLINGRHGRYLPVPEALFFDDGARLRVRIYGGGAMEEQTVANHRFGSRVRLLQVSETRLLYSIDPDATIMSYDVHTRESQSLPAVSERCGLDGALWIEVRNALLCKRADDYAFVSLDGEVVSTLDLPDATSFHAVAHLDDQDALVLVETWNAAVSGRARYAIWVYDLANDGMVRLVREQHLGQSVVYRAN